MSGVVLQKGITLIYGRALMWHCTCSFIRQIIVISDASVLGFACLKGPTNESAG